mmetsp:Transcript_42815/g.105534  ORF Transcript_42815/g.105534 Transcript_42815/m.105534 type:complete len:222 (-) Transcript_42815:1015-1680(-)
MTSIIRRREFVLTSRLPHRMSLGSGAGPARSNNLPVGPWKEGVPRPLRPPFLKKQQKSPRPTSLRGKEARHLRLPSSNSKATKATPTGSSRSALSESISTSYSSSVSSKYASFFCWLARSARAAAEKGSSPRGLSSSDSLAFSSFRANRSHCHCFRISKKCAHFKPSPTWFTSPNCWQNACTRSASSTASHSTASRERAGDEGAGERRPAESGRGARSLGE